MSDHVCSPSRYYHRRHDGCEGCRELGLIARAEMSRQRRQRSARQKLATAWMDRAACKGADPNTFVPDFQTRHQQHAWRQLAKAVAVCATCPVAAACGNYGRTNRLSGVYGGELLTLGKRSPRTEAA